jgi:hypothetical protein
MDMEPVSERQAFARALKPSEAHHLPSGVGPSFTGSDLDERNPHSLPS